jgi:hypothetical protein
MAPPLDSPIAFPLASTYGQLIVVLKEADAVRITTGMLNACQVNNNDL